MKYLKLLVIFMVFGLLISVACQAQEIVTEENYLEEELVGKTAEFAEDGFYVYIDDVNRLNHSIPSGWMGDYGDIKMNLKHKDNPHSGKTCIRFDYTAQGKQGAGWCGIFWQNPANNWGEKKGGFDIRGAKKLTFWARGDKGNERIMEFKIGGIGGTYPDSDSMGIGPIDLTAQWQQYTIELTDIDLAYINGVFCWATNADSNPEGCVFYLDDIRYEK
ncbi:MAG: hypothetical protein HY810_06880 [Candidatus Omnitrophica bacterium]|nr:hypothetical protein [Candidatus Omnitrophota bacterium]